MGCRRKLMALEETHTLQRECEIPYRQQLRWGLNPCLWPSETITAPLSPEAVQLPQRHLCWEHPICNVNNYALHICNTMHAMQNAALQNAALREWIFGWKHYYLTAFLRNPLSFGFHTTVTALGQFKMLYKLNRYEDESQHYYASCSKAISDDLAGLVHHISCQLKADNTPVYGLVPFGQFECKLNTLQFIKG